MCSYGEEAAVLKALNALLMKNNMQLRRRIDELEARWRPLAAEEAARGDVCPDAEGLKAELAEVRSELRSYKYFARRVLRIAETAPEGAFCDD